MHTFGTGKSSFGLRQALPLASGISTTAGETSSSATLRRLWDEALANASPSQLREQGGELKPYWQA